MTNHIPASENLLSRERWQVLDRAIQTWWDGDLHTAHEQDLINDASRTLLFLPSLYSSAGGSEAIFPEMYAWDTYFINLGLLAHGRTDIVRHHILNYLFAIQRWGFMPNGNRTYYLTRSQTPVFHDSIWRYYQATGERDILYLAYPYLKQEYTAYWNAPHHQTPTGLATNCDLGDPGIDARLAAIAETGLDFTALFGPDVRQCNPLITNCALVRYARTLAALAQELGVQDEAEQWRAEAERRGQLIQQYCWNEEQGFFFDYNVVEQRQQPFWSLCAYWTLWAGVATQEQAAKLVSHLHKFEHQHGLSFTDQLYPSPLEQFTWVQWGYPSGWPPMHIITVAGLADYGYSADARRIAEKYVALMVQLYEQNGFLYEKYNVVDGNVDLPFERQHETPPFHGWSSAAAVVLGRYLFS